jgi:hypothetical protein
VTDLLRQAVDALKQQEDARAGEQAQVVDVLSNILDAIQGNAPVVANF